MYLRIKNMIRLSSRIHTHFCKYVCVHRTMSMFKRFLFKTVTLIVLSKSKFSIFLKYSEFNLNVLQGKLIIEMKNFDDIF